MYAIAAVVFLALTRHLSLPSPAQSNGPVLLRHSRILSSLFQQKRTQTTMSTTPNNIDLVEQQQPRQPDNMETIMEQRMRLLRDILPASQPQEGSPANTFTVSELADLQAALAIDSTTTTDAAAAADKVGITAGTWFSEPNTDSESSAEKKIEEPQNANYQDPVSFRQAVRKGLFQGPTNGVCPGRLQINLVVLPAGPIAFDFLLFCQRNSQACPLLEVCEGATTSFIPKQLATGADLRTDIPKYAIYRDGALQEEVTDCTEYWPENAVAFLIGCSFSYDGALQNAGIPLRSAEAGKNVPMYKTNIPCEPAGILRGNMVVSMKPIPCLQVAKEVEITGKYKHAHGAPVCVGCPTALGIDLSEPPDWGEAIDVRDDEVPVFHACGVTPQLVLMESKVPFAITHSAGHMFVTDAPSDMGVL